MVSNCGFSFHFPDEWWYWASFLLLIGYLHFSFHPIYSLELSHQLRPWLPVTWASNGPIHGILNYSEIYIYFSEYIFSSVQFSSSVVSDSLWPHGLYTVHGILQARILEWVAFPFSTGSSQPRGRTQVSCIAGGFFTRWATREAWHKSNLHR